MDIDLFLRAPAIIQIHALAAMAAFVLGAVQLLRRKGDAGHRLAGRIWVALMAVVAVSGFFIHEIRLVGLFSPIHLLSLFVLYWLVQAVRTARRGDIANHRLIVKGMYFGGLIVAGAFTFLPGRLNFDVFVEPWLEAPPVLPQWWPIAGVAISIAGAVAAWVAIGRWQRTGARRG